MKNSSFSQKKLREKEFIVNFVTVVIITTVTKYEIL